MLIVWPVGVSVDALSSHLIPWAPFSTSSSIRFFSRSLSSVHTFLLCRVFFSLFHNHLLTLHHVFPPVCFARFPLDQCFFSFRLPPLFSHLPFPISCFLTFHIFHPSLASSTSYPFFFFLHTTADTVRCQHVSTEKTAPCIWPRCNLMQTCWLARSYTRTMIFELDKKM